MDLMISAALIELATKGYPVNLQKKIGGEIVYKLKTDRGALREDEHYATPALEINGTIYIVIGPGLTTDNFIIQTSDLLSEWMRVSVRGIMFCALLLQHL